METHIEISGTEYEQHSSHIIQYFFNGDLTKQYFHTIFTRGLLKEGSHLISIFLYLSSKLKVLINRQINNHIGPSGWAPEWELDSGNSLPFFCANWTKHEASVMYSIATLKEGFQNWEVLYSLSFQIYLLNLTWQSQFILNLEVVYMNKR